MENASNSTPYDFDSLIDFFRIYPDDKACMTHLKHKRWPDGKPVCQECGSLHVHTRKCGFKFVCLDCKKNFTVKSNTIFGDTKVGLQKWYLAAYLVSTNVKGISSYQLAEKLKVSQKTSWFMLQRIRFGQEQFAFDHMETDSVQIDECFVGGLEKWKHWDKKTEGNQGRSTKTKTTVFGMLSPTQGILAVVVPDATAETVCPIIEFNSAEGSTVITDEFTSYKSLKSSFNHEVVHHKRREFARGENNEITVNGVENYWSHMKGMIRGTHHHVSRKHLNTYVNSQSFRFNRRDNKDHEIFSDTIASAIEKRLTWRELTAK